MTQTGRASPRARIILCRVAPVAVQEPVLRVVQINVGWEMPPRFPDVRGELTDAFREITEDSGSWFWDSNSPAGMVFASNEEKQLYLLATPDGLDIVSEAPDVGTVISAADVVISDCMRILNLKSLRHAAGGAAWTLAAEDTKGAEAALESWLFMPQMRTRLGALGGRPSDIILTLRFDTETGVTTTLKTEPLTDEQAAEGPYFLSEDLDASEFPPAVLYVSVNRSQAGDFSAGDAATRGRRYLQQILKHGAELFANVDNRDDGSDEA